ncbi:hypothetical protein [Desulfogranum japonicum]|uniref:hypothetical protein n=1 Tax=Desulfogranum japonicum TaxID=231447 RepID=UPI0003FD858F|nr:hypothetical protein [Desulfogranum japonicum]
MAKKGKIRTYFSAGVALLVFCVWLVINIRVEAGFAGPLERAFDGLVAGIFLLVIVFTGLCYFTLPPRS